MSLKNAEAEHVTGGRGLSELDNRNIGALDALALVRTPLQLLNAVEARLHFGFERAALVIVEYSGVGIPPFDHDCIKASDWAHVVTIDLNPKPKPFPYTWLDHPGLVSSEKAKVLKQLYQRRVMDEALRPWRDVPHLLLGNYLQGWFRHAAQRCPRAHCILLDDGTDTLRIAGHRQQIGEQREPASFWAQPKTWWYQRYAAWDTRQREQVTFFSSYQLELSANDRFVQNTFEKTRQRIKTIACDHRCLFLGQPLVEDGYITTDEFARQLTAIKQSLAGYDLVYIPHRREDRSLLDPLLADLGIPLLVLGKAFEYWLLSTPVMPAAIASFFSSALDNCRLIMGRRTKILAFRLPLSTLLVAHEYVAQVYDYFSSIASEGIEIMEPGDRV